MKPKNEMKGGLIRPLSKAAVIVTALAAAVAQQLQGGPSPETINSLLQERNHLRPAVTSSTTGCSHCEGQIWREAPAGQGGWVSFSQNVNTGCISVENKTKNKTFKVAPIK